MPGGRCAAGRAACGARPTPTPRETYAIDAADREECRIDRPVHRCRPRRPASARGALPALLDGVLTLARAHFGAATPFTFFVASDSPAVSRFTAAHVRRRAPDAIVAYHTSDDSRLYQHTSVAADVIRLSEADVLVDSGFSTFPLVAAARSLCTGQVRASLSAGYGAERRAGIRYPPLGGAAEAPRILRHAADGRPLLGSSFLTMWVLKWLAQGADHGLGPLLRADSSHRCLADEHVSRAAPSAALMAAANQSRCFEHENSSCRAWLAAARHSCTCYFKQALK